jgi:hypothetical protein
MFLGRSLRKWREITFGRKPGGRGGEGIDSRVDRAIQFLQACLNAAHELRKRLSYKLSERKSKTREARATQWWSAMKTLIPGARAGDARAGDDRQPMLDIRVVILPQSSKRLFAPRAGAA